MSEAGEQDQRYEQFTLPISIKSELFRLATTLGLDTNDIDTEEDCLNMLNDSIRAVDRIKNDSKVLSHSTSNFHRPDPADTQHDKKLAAKAKGLEDDLRISLKTFDDAASLKSKISHLNGQVRKEKEQRAALEKFIESQNKKIMLLIAHVDKLMKALKRESGKVIRSLEANRQLEKDMFGCNNKIEKQAKVIAVQNR
jgi:hypothetical protein